MDCLGIAGQEKWWDGGGGGGLRGDAWGLYPPHTLPDVLRNFIRILLLVFCLLASLAGWGWEDRGWGN